MSMVEMLAKDLMQDQFLSPNKDASGMENLDDLCNDEAMVHANCQRKKKKKKSKRHVISPLQIFAFSQEKQQKLIQEKASLPCTKDMVKKALLKCATFPSSSTIEQLNFEGMKPSCRPRSALHGSREDKGLEPRPKLQVKWATEVFEPSTTSISHTIGLHQQESRKAELLRGQSLKSSKSQKSTERTDMEISARCRGKLIHEQGALTSIEAKHQDGIISHDGACDQEKILGSSPDGPNEFLMLSDVDGFDNLSLKCSSQYGHISHKDLVMPTKVCNLQHVSHCKKSMSGTDCSFDLTNASVHCNNTQTAIIHQSVGCHLCTSSLVTKV